jgi:hypothetical protein
LEAVAADCTGAAGGPGADEVALGACAVVAAAADAAEIVTVRRSPLKLAITGIVAFTVTIAVPLFSL